MTQQPILHIDATPDADYVLRILRAYRQHASCNIEVHGVSDAEKIIYDAMNEANVARAELLDVAIKKIGG